MQAAISSDPKIVKAYFLLIIFVHNLLLTFDWFINVQDTLFTRYGCHGNKTNYISDDFALITEWW